MGKRTPKPGLDDGTSQRRLSFHGRTTGSVSREAIERKKASHRRASAAYEARHPELKEKRRLQMVARRAAAKLKRRQWDPPKKTPKQRQTPPAASADESVTESHVVLDLRAENLQILDAAMLQDKICRPTIVNTSDIEVAAAPSLNSAEKVALVALAEMGAGATGDGTHVDKHCIGNGVSLRSQGGCAEVCPNIPGTMFTLTDIPPHQSMRVSQARAAVAKLNDQPFSDKLLSDVMMWDDLPPLERAQYLPMGTASYIRVRTWRHRVRDADDGWDLATAKAMEELAQNVATDRMVERLLFERDGW
ncbi:hypothetical protein DFH09DRAFT_1078663 [Mycena vulgaris]|nr:hypothetical protein DFH09DRAFT_1078663 [Mycena vulgaris]